MPGGSKDNCSCGFPGWPEVGQARAGIHAAPRLLAAPEPWHTKKSLCAGIGLSCLCERFYTMLRLRASCNPESSPRLSSMVFRGFSVCQTYGAARSPFTPCCWAGLGLGFALCLGFFQPQSYRPGPAAWQKEAS